MMKMKLEDFGYKSNFDDLLENNEFKKSDIGRVSAVYKNRYVVLTESGETSATLTGNFQFSVENQTEFPTVGDWVVLQIFDEEGALVIKVLPRFSFLERRAVGKGFDRQLIAANIDYGLIVEAVGENFKLNRLERYLAVCNSAKIEPIILLTKIDLMDNKQVNDIVATIKNRISDINIFAISNVSGAGIDNLNSILKRGKTYCLLGLSGVGKSTLINNLFGKDILETKSISDSTQKGVHTTTHRELFILNNGSLIIDNPGMREIGLTDSSDALEITFDKITELSAECKFSDCTHTHEKNCAILNAIDNGSLERSQYDNYMKMKREQFHFQASVVEKRKRDKEFGKMIKNVMKNKKKKRN